MSKKLLSVLIVLLAGSMTSCYADEDISKTTLATIPLQSSTGETEASSTSLMTVETTEASDGQFDYEIDIDLEENRLTGYWNYNDQTINIDAVIFNEYFPENLNIYRINYSDSFNYEWDDNIWMRRSFDTVCLLSGKTSMPNGGATHVIDEPGYMHLDREENKSVINSLCSLSVEDLPFAYEAQLFYPDNDLCGYALYYGFPAKTEPSNYNIYNWSPVTGVDYISESVQSVDYYVIREVIDGIPVGLPDDYRQMPLTHFVSTGVESELENPYCEQYYDGNHTVCQINTLANVDHLEIIENDQPIKPLEEVFEQVFIKLKTIVDDEDNYREREDYIYSVEIVWLENSVYDTQADQVIGNYLVPYWVIGYQCYCKDRMGDECVVHAPIYINAIDGTAWFNGETIYEK